jgi:ribosome biogenesis GTPase
MDLPPSLTPYGWSDRWAALYADFRGSDPPSAPVAPARVVRHDGSAVLAASAAGVRSLPVLATVDPPPVVGDWVVITDDAVVGTLPRMSLLRRRDPARATEQPLVANVDAVLIVCGLDRPVKPGRIQRAVAAAWDAGALPVVVLTKADLLDPVMLDDPLSTVAAASPGIDVLTTSTTDGTGLDEVRAVVVDRTVVLLGESGAGKSSLTNALVGEHVADTAAVRRGDAKGRHTTTSRQLHLLPSGGVLIDTPGLRALGLSAEPDAVAATFDDVESLATGCRFGDCSHGGEPGCAVQAAIADGQLAPERFAAWDALLREAEATALRADTHAHRTQERRFSRMAKEAQRHKRPRPDT